MRIKLGFEAAEEVVGSRGREGEGGMGNEEGGLMGGGEGLEFAQEDVEVGGGVGAADDAVASLADEPDGAADFLGEGFEGFDEGGGLGGEGVEAEGDGAVGGCGFGGGGFGGHPEAEAAGLGGGLRNGFEGACFGEGADEVDLGGADIGAVEEADDDDHAAGGELEGIFFEALAADDLDVGG